MILTPHFLLGAVVTTYISPLPLAIFFAFVSHYLLDAIPHWDYSVTQIKQRRWEKSLGNFISVWLDVTLGTALIFFFAPHKIVAFLGGIFAMLPDLLTFLAILFPQNTLLQSHWRFHEHTIHWFHKRNVPISVKLGAELSAIIFALLLLLQSP